MAPRDLDRERFERDFAAWRDEQGYAPPGGGGGGVLPPRVGRAAMAVESARRAGDCAPMTFFLNPFARALAELVIDGYRERAALREILDDRYVEHLERLEHEDAELREFVEAELLDSLHIGEHVEDAELRAALAAFRLAALNSGEDTS